MSLPLLQVVNPFTYRQPHTGLCVLKLCPKAFSKLIQFELCVVLGVLQQPKIKSMQKRTKGTYKLISLGDEGLIS